MSDLSGSVGKGGKNLEQDVKQVQTLLKAAGCDPGPINGICGNKTIAAITKFQGRLLADPDGLIEPGKTTWKMLSSREMPGATGEPGAWTGDSTRWTQEKKLQSLNPTLRPKIANVIQALKKRGFHPQIFYGWRSINVQLELVRLGHSTVKFSFHNAQKSDGTPNAYAADIVDERFGWGAEAEASGFWRALGEEAKKEGLKWGGDWSSFRDWAHVQLVDNRHLKEVKRESGL